MGINPVPWCDSPVIDPNSAGGMDIREIPCGECEACMRGLVYDCVTGEVFDASGVLVVEDEVNLARCDHYQGCGTCSFGCWEEPACMTSGPWPAVEWTPYEANSIAIRRYAYQMRNWLGWRRLGGFLDA